MTRSQVKAITNIEERSRPGSVLPPAPAPPEGDEGPDPRELLRVVLRYKWAALAVALAVLSAVVFWTLGQPNIYEATCSIEYDPNPPRPLGRDVEDVTAPYSMMWLTQEFYETQNRILQSRALSERVVQRLGLNHDADFMDVPEERRSSWSGASVEDAASLLQRRITVEPVKDTRIVDIKVRDRDPERAKTLVNALADAYIEKTMEDRMGTTVSALEWLSTQLDTLQGELETSELALHEFKRDNNVLSVSLEDRQNIVAASIQRLSEAVDTTRMRRIELSARLAQLRRANREDPSEVSASVVSADPTVNALRQQYGNKSAELEALAVSYGDAHPTVSAVRAELASLRDQMRVRIDGLLQSAAADLAEASASEQGLRQALEEVHNEGLEINLREIEYSRLSREQESNAKVYGIVLERTTETQLTRQLRVENVRIVDRALTPRGPVSPRVFLNVAIGLVLALGLGLAFPFLLARLDRTIKQAQDAEDAGLTILGILPSIGEESASDGRPERKRRRRATARAGRENRDLVVFTNPRSTVAECARTIRTNLSFMAADAPVRAIVVTSASPKEGKTTVAASLAIALAQAHKRVLLVDTDLRRPRIHTAFGLSSARGVTSVLVDEASLADATIATDVPGLDVLPCGPIPPNPAELLHTTKFRELIERSLERYDTLIFDSPPLGAVIDAAVIAPQVDGVVLVVKAKSTVKDSLTGALRQLRDVGAKLLGGVLNDVDLSERQYGYGSYYYYYRSKGYYASDEEASSGADAA